MTPRLQFGVSLLPSVQPLSAHLELVHAAESSGLDLIGIQDHPYHPGFLDTFAVIGMLLARTERVRFFPDVANLPLRPPAVLAKMAASLDLFSGGRFELGLGAGGYWQAISTLGVARLTAREALQAAGESIGVIRAMWANTCGVELSGHHYSLQQANTGPAPAHTVGIWLGAHSPGMFEVTGRLADGWAAPIPSYLPYERSSPAQQQIDTAARHAGRHPSSIRRIAQVVGTIAPDPQSDWVPTGADPLRGVAAQWAEEIRYLSNELRFDTFIFWPEQASIEQIDRFARDVVSAALASHSSQPPA
jgi:alkanesulfonate monooxygenase SsuD/methylene tetrahydromethanopterin reductase-like flavin-dependent oxidoreductase (luciferase family)